MVGATVIPTDFFSTASPPPAAAAVATAVNASSGILAGAAEAAAAAASPGVARLAGSSAATAATAAGASRAAVAVGNGGACTAGGLTLLGVEATNTAASEMLTGDGCVREDGSRSRSPMVATTSAWPRQPPHRCCPDRTNAVGFTTVTTRESRTPPAVRRRLSPPTFDTAAPGHTRHAAPPPAGAQLEWLCVRGRPCVAERDGDGARGQREGSVARDPTSPNPTNNAGPARRPLPHTNSSTCTDVGTAPDGERLHRYAATASATARALRCTATQAAAGQAGRRGVQERGERRRTWGTTPTDALNSPPRPRVSAAHVTR